MPQINNPFGGSKGGGSPLFEIKQIYLKPAAYGRGFWAILKKIVKFTQKAKKIRKSP